MRVLLVEDSSATRAFLRGALESEFALDDLDVSEAEGGFEALRLLPRGTYQLVITDINMPDINGLELLNFIRKSSQHRRTKVLLISTQAAEKDRDRGLALGADGYLTKPFSADDLAAAVRKLLPESAGHG